MKKPLHLLNYVCILLFLILPMTAGCRRSSSSLPETPAVEKKEDTTAVPETPKPQAEDSDPVISSDFDPYLQWHAEDYESADASEKENAAKAALLYLGVTDSGVSPLPPSEIESGLAYADENPDKVLSMADIYFDQAVAYDFTLKEVIDHNLQVSEEYLQDSYEDEDIEIFGYEEYLDYTGTMFSSASSEEQERVMTAGMIYLMKYRMNQEVTEETVDYLAEVIHSPESAPAEVAPALEALRLLIETEPDKSFKQLIDQF